MSDEEKTTFRADLERLEGFRFQVRFDDGDSGFVMDEPPPMGEGSGPNPTRVLAAAVADCLSASLLFCLRKARIEVDDLDATVEGSLTRNEDGRLRIEGLHVRIRPTLTGDEGRIRRCLELFEDFCVVTESVRKGIDVAVDVEVASKDATDPGGSPTSDPPLVNSST